MKFRVAISLIVVVGTIACSPDQKLLDEYESIKTIFSQEQITGLKSIIEFFNGSICESANTDAEKIADCYRDFFNTVRESNEAGSMEIPISYHKQVKFLQSLNPNLTEQIWSNSFRIKGADTSQVMQIKSDGEYAEFLKQYGKENAKASKYVNLLTTIGTISPTMVADLILDSEEYDVQDERMQLLVAVHYLTLNDRFKAGLYVD